MGPVKPKGLQTEENLGSVVAEPQLAVRLKKSVYLQ